MLEKDPAGIADHQLRVLKGNRLMFFKETMQKRHSNPPRIVGDALAWGDFAPARQSRVSCTKDKFKLTECLHCDAPFSLSGQL